MLRSSRLWEFVLLVAVFFVYAGDPAPMVNEAHYLVKAKNFWNPDWCSGDLFAASAKAHTTYYLMLGWLTQLLSLEATAWIGRVAGWCVLAWGLQRLTHKLTEMPLAVLGVAVIWIAGIEYGNLAGEWVVGGTEAKVFAYGLVLAALSAICDRNWNLAWIALGGASAFHVLSGGWAVIAVALVWLVTERPLPDRKPLFCRGLFIGGGIALLGLVPALALTAGASGEESTDAARIYSYFRISHHLLPAALHWTWWVRHGVLILLTIVSYTLVRRNGSPNLAIVFWFAGGAVAIAFAGCLVGILPSVMPDLAAKLLRYYWFRLTDAAVPLAFAVIVICALGRANLADSKTARRLTYALCGCVLLSATVLVGRQSVKRMRYAIPPSHSNWLLGFDRDSSAAEQQGVFEDWLAVCWWVQQSTPSDEVFLTPRHQQTFKWYAERAEVVNFKDVPQDAASLLEWDRRLKEIYPSRLGTMRVTIQYRDLRRYREKYGVQYMIVDQRICGTNLPLLKLYPRQPEKNATYAVYELPR